METEGCVYLRCKMTYRFYIFIPMCQDMLYVSLSGFYALATILGM